MEWTSEQNAVRNATADSLAVLAYAGTGKTSTLVEWAQAHPHERALYLAFNRSVRDEAMRRFPAQVRVVTSHALAFATTGHAYQSKLVGGLRPFAVMQALGFDWVPYRQRLYHVQLALETLQAFFASRVETIGSEMVPVTPERERLGLNAVPIARDAQRIWDRMQKAADQSIGMGHDGYLKLFVMQRPNLPYDVVLFDEAQDANPVTIQLIEGQTRARKIWVGDPWQAIYGFRGAINAMDTVQAAQTLRLTGSFRFGSAIADVATQLLRWRDPSPPALRGLAAQPGVVQVDVPSAQPYTFLARTNARLFAEAVTMLTRTPNARLGFVGGINGYRLDLIEDTYRLSMRQPVRDPFLKLIGTFSALRRYAKTVSDVEYLMRCKVVDQWGASIPQWLQRIRAATGPVEEAHYVLSTAHKAKGLEWPIVQLADDFPEIEEDRARWAAWTQMPPERERERDRLAEKLLAQEELNLLYVAVTRARSELCLPAQLRCLV